MATYEQLVPALTYPRNARLGPNKIAYTITEFHMQVAGLVPGDWLWCHGIQFTGEIAIKKSFTAVTGKLPPYAKISFDANCAFLGVATQANLPALWIQAGSSYLQLVFQGCPITNTLGGAGILQHASHHIVIDQPYITAVGGSGVFAAPIGGDIHDCFYRVQPANIGLNHAYDPHSDPGSGLHGFLAGDTSQGVFRDNVVAVYGHDCTYSGGSVLQLGDSNPAYAPHGNRIYVKGTRMLYDASTQVGGNGVNAWGYMHDNTFEVIEVDTIAGVPYSSDLNTAQPGNVVKAGSAVNWGLNPRYAAKKPVPWQATPGGTVFQAVTAS